MSNSPKVRLLAIVCVLHIIQHGVCGVCVYGSKRSWREHTKLFVVNYNVIVILLHIIIVVVVIIIIIINAQQILLI